MRARCAGRLTRPVARTTGAGVPAPLRAGGRARHAALGIGGERKRLLVANSPPIRRSGWVTFAGVVGLMAGAYHALSGIGALTDDDTIRAQSADVLFGINVTAWGWFWLLLGAAQLVAGYLILQRNEWGRWLGIVMAGLSALLTVFVIFVFPLWAISVLILDCMVLYALTSGVDDFNP
jgi:hypothetical protein